jgi:hypothetical protein
VAVDSPCEICGVPFGPADWCQVETCPGYGLRGAELDAAVADRRSRNPDFVSREAKGTLSADEAAYALECIEIRAGMIEIEHRWAGG